MTNSDDIMLHTGQGTDVLLAGVAAAGNIRLSAPAWLEQSGDAAWGTRHTFFWSVAFALLIGSGFAAAQESPRSPFETERSRGAEQSISLNIEGDYGRVQFRRDTRDRLYSVAVLDQDNANKPLPLVRYEMRGDEAIVTIDLTEGMNDDGLEAFSHMFGRSGSPRWEITVSDRIPVKLRMEIGAGNADLDLTGLRMRALAMESGAGNVRITVGAPNLEPMKHVSIETGLGSLQSLQLGNLGFESLHFEGGMGSYALDLSGAVRNSAVVSAEVGLGSLTLTLPQGVGIRLRNEDSWFTSSRLPGFVRSSDSRYESVDFDRSSRRMMVRVNSGMGSVRVQWK